MKSAKKLYPKLKRSIASYDHSNFFIFLEDISQKDLITIRENPLAANNVENIKTLFHEIKHYADHIGTLWGQKKILNYLKALNVRVNGDIMNFHEIVKYKNEESQLFYSNYYSEEYNYFPVTNLANRWRWTTTTGLRFNEFGLPNESKPIPFVHFRSHDEKPLIRVPISIASLLETNSTAEEIYWHRIYLSSISETERPFHAKFFENDVLLKLIYNQELVVYNVAVHITANLLEITDIIEAFEISSRVASLVLNLPNEYVIQIPFQETKFSTTTERAKFMLENNEYGFVFYLLLENYSKKYKETKKYNLEDLLSTSKLPGSETIHAKVLNEMNLIYNEAIKHKNLKEIFFSKLEFGTKVFNELGIDSSQKKLAEVIHEKLPTLICNDTEINFKSFSDQELFSLKPYANLSTSDWYNLSDALYKKLSEHYVVRGV
ncbi:hypothetical protein [Flavobacterium sp. J27]|uniref:hypothetical protein n=1 Tax=Flavobacterium sp. J27 TaxID=2060419 RepID=UPI0010313592|nr:hypothetical protein [Flavobacterium sp. J27]